MESGKSFQIHKLGKVCNEPYKELSSIVLLFTECFRFQVNLKSRLMEFFAHLILNIVS